MHDGDLLPFVLAVCAYLCDVEVELLDPKVAERLALIDKMPH